MNLFWGKLWFVSLSNSWDAALLQSLLCSGEADMQSIAICSTHFRCRAAILTRLHRDLDHHCVHICKGFGGFIYIIIYIIYIMYICKGLGGGASSFRKTTLSFSLQQPWLSPMSPKISEKQTQTRPWVNKYCLQFSYFMKCGAVLKTFVNKEKTFVGNFHCGDVHCPLQRPFFNFRNRNLIQFHFLPLSSIVF